MEAIHSEPLVSGDYDVLDLPTVESPLSESISQDDDQRARRSDRESSESRLLQVIAVAANEASTPEDALQIALDRICVHTGWPVGHAYLVSDDSSDLIPTKIWHFDAPASRFETFRRLTEVIRIPRGNGLVGKVLETGEPDWVLDINEGPSPRARIASESLPVKAGFAFPVLIGPEVVAVLEFFSTEAVAPDRAWLKVTANIGTQLGRVIERARAKEFQTRMMGVIGHDLKNPLNVVTLSAQALAESKTLSERDRTAAFRIQAVAGRMQRIIHDLIDYSSARVGGGITVWPAAAELDEICREVLSEIASSHADREIHYETEGEGGGSWDRPRLHQVLENLVINAIKYSPSDAPVRLRWRGLRDHLIIVVHNSGEPISKALLPHIFEPFRRGTNIDSVDSGVGLGLYIVREIVRAHGGMISVQSNEGGTTFIVQIPRHAKYAGRRTQSAR